MEEGDEQTEIEFLVQSDDTRFHGAVLTPVQVTIIDTPIDLCPQGDLYLDCEINFQDLSILVGEWLGDSGSVANLNYDEAVDVKDMAILAQNWLVGWGALQVTIEPAQAVGEGAQWSIDGGASWQNSGETLIHLQEGSYSVEFKSISDWNEPSPQSENVVHNQTEQITGTYEIATGDLQVAITPSEVASGDGRWRVDEGIWRISGDTASGLPVGIHIVEFIFVAGYARPLNKEVAIVDGSLYSTQGDYIPVPVTSLKINEFMASNNSLSGIADPQGQYDDWFEIYNPTDSSVDIGGMYLKDADQNTWQIPTDFAAQTTILTGGYLVLWADNDTADGPLHVGFQLNADNDAIYLYDTDGLALLDSVIFSEQISNVSYGRYPDGSSVWYYFNAASPGTTNDTQTTFTGQVADTTFNPDRGFYDTDINVEIATATPGAVIYYTTDGNDPIAPGGTPTSTAQTYSGPIHISKNTDGTTSIRAAAVKTGWLPTNIDTHTYLYLDDVLAQDGTGLPPYSPWGGLWKNGYPSTGDWEVDPEVTTSGPWTDLNGQSFTMEDVLMVVPTVSLVMDWDDWFGDSGQGIYISGEDVEKICSAEWISPDGSEDGFQENCTVQIVGGSSPIRWKCDKLSMRLKFRKALDDGTPTGGPGKLNYDMFSDTKVDEFNTIVLEARSTFSWAYGSDGQSVGVSIDGIHSLQNYYAQYTRDQFAPDVQNAMGGYGQHGRPVHLYLNGLYWGMYITHERPDGAFAASYLGGNKEDYDALKHRPGVSYVLGFDDDPAMKTLVAANYDALSAAANQDLTNPANYQTVLNLVDVDNLIDYMIANFYVANTDWAGSNWYVTRNRVDPAGRWRYHMWDSDHTLKNATDNLVTRDNGDGSPTDLHRDLRTNEEYKLRFADHVHKYFFNDGILTPAKVEELYMNRIATVDRAVVGESARWGDNGIYAPATPYSRDGSWMTELNRLRNGYFPVRSNNVLNQLKNDGMYPNVDAPVFYINGSYQHSGYIAS